MSDKDEIIEKGSTGFWGRNDCEERSEMALEKFPDFFTNPDHLKKVDEVIRIVTDFFPIKKGVYTNRRVGNRKTGPFTTVKIDDPVFPNWLKQSEKDELYYNPLDALGVIRHYNKGTNSYILHIK